MKGDIVKVIDKSMHVDVGDIKCYKPFVDANQQIIRDKKGLINMIASRTYPVGTIGVVEDSFEKVSPHEYIAVPVRIKFDKDDPGEVWWFSADNIHIVGHVGN